MKKNEQPTSTLQTIDRDPEWIKMQKEQMSLVIREQQVSARHKEASIADMRIESARRNADWMASKLMQIYEMGQPKELEALRCKLDEAFSVNIKVLSEIHKIS